MSPKLSWRESLAKQILAKDIQERRVTSVSNMMEVYHMHNGIFLEYEFKKFQGYLKTLLKSHEKNDHLASVDAAALKNDLKYHPRDKVCSKEYPRWDGSTAQALLKQDVTAQLAESTTPAAVENSKGI